jgi:hypothetical protein
MADPYRDHHAAAHARIARLEEENRELRVHARPVSQRWSTLVRRRRVGSVLAAAIGVSIGLVLLSRPPSHVGAVSFPVPEVKRTSPQYVSVFQGRGIHSVRERQLVQAVYLGLATPAEVDELRHLCALRGDAECAISIAPLALFHEKQPEPAADAPHPR